MSSRRSTDHVVIDIQRQNYRCNHCGEKRRLVLPVAVSVMGAECKAFIAAHKDCKKPKEAQRDE